VLGAGHGGAIKPNQPRPVVALLKEEDPALSLAPSAETLS
jgi:hypothetical protein